MAIHNSRSRRSPDVTDDQHPQHSVGQGRKVLPQIQRSPRQERRDDKACLHKITKKNRISLAILVIILAIIVRCKKKVDQNLVLQNTPVKSPRFGYLQDLIIQNKTMALIEWRFLLRSAEYTAFLFASIRLSQSPTTRAGRSKWRTQFNAPAAERPSARCRLQ